MKSLYTWICAALALFVAAGVMISLTQNDEEKFPNFQKIEIAGQDTGYSFDPTTAVRKDNITAFSLLRRLKDGYALQTAATDCKHKLSFQEGTFYPVDKEKAPETYPGSRESYDFNNDSGIKALAIAACNAVSGATHVSPAEHVAKEDENSPSSEAFPKPCNEVFPCQLAGVIDSQEWEKVRSAVSFANQMNVKDKVQWSGKTANRHGYVLFHDDMPDGCRRYDVGIEDQKSSLQTIIVCQMSDGAIDIK
jgi:hypothetical protein